MKETEELFYIFRNFFGRVFSSDSSYWDFAVSEEHFFKYI